MLKAALTGSIASGKSTVLDFFKSRGVATIDSDKIVAELYRQRKVQEKIRQEFGSIERKKIAEIVFGDSEKRKSLEKILHPLVVKEIELRFAELENQGAKLVVVEVPLLFETGLEKMFDKVIAVHCSEEQQTERLVGKQSLGEEQALKRIKSQLPSNEKVKKADFTLDNSQGLDELFRQAEKILGELKWLKEL